MNRRCPDCWEIMSLENPGELLWDYLDLPSRRALALMASWRLRVFACYGCGYWTPAGRPKTALSV